MPVPAQPLHERFWRFVAVCEHGRTCTQCCHLWIGRRSRTKYGHLTSPPSVIKKTGIATRLAHRIAWQLRYGPILPTQYVCHACDNPPCVNVHHLWLGDAQSNHEDAMRKGRKPLGDYHPMRRHPERAARGDRNGSRKYIERMPRGEANARAILTDESVYAIRAYARLGYTQEQIAAIYTISPSNVWQIVQRRTWVHLKEEDAPPFVNQLGQRHDGTRRGEAATGAKLTAEQIPGIRELAAAMVRYGDIAAQYGISRALVCLIVQRKCWAHID